VVRQAERREATIRAIEAAARRLFDAHGFEATSVDDIAAKAGVAKGAVYHHFPSKEALFARVLEGIQAELAALPPPASARKLTDPRDLVADAALRYLLAASEPGRRRILLIDGPAVIGWRKWREIDDRHFGAGARAGVAAMLGPGATPAEVDALAHLVLGAVMEAALVCAAAEDPKGAARKLAAGLRRMLQGLRGASS
jgi:AcrR family transcriptional regulator